MSFDSAHLARYAAFLAVAAVFGIVRELLRIWAGNRDAKIARRRIEQVIAARQGYGDWRPANRIDTSREWRDRRRADVIEGEFRKVRVH